MTKQLNKHFFYSMLNKDTNRKVTESEINTLIKSILSYLKIEYIEDNYYFYIKGELDD